MARLEDICIINPKAPVLADDLEVSFVPMPKVGEQGEFDPSEIKEYREVKKGFTNFQNGDVLFAKITPCMENGKGAVAKDLKNGYGFGSTEFHVLRPDYSKVTSEWLYYLTSWNAFRKDAESNMTGSAGQKRVPKTFLEKYEVNLPEVEKQNEMADTLEYIGKLIALRKEQLAKLDELVKSRFIELFGDQKANPFGWPQTTIGDCCTLKSGTSLPADKENEGGRIPYVKVGDMNYPGNEQYITTSSRFVTEQTAGAGIFPVGTVIFPKRGGAIGTNKKRLTTLPICADLNVMGVTAGNALKSQYLMAYFNLVDLGALDNGSSVPQINNKDIAPLVICLPPLALQEQFAAFVEQTDKSKLAIQESLAELETLKKALMQKYFG